MKRGLGRLCAEIILPLAGGVAEKRFLGRANNAGVPDEHRNRLPWRGRWRSAVSTTCCAGSDVRRGTHRQALDDVEAVANLLVKQGRVSEGAAGHGRPGEAQGRALAEAVCLDPSDSE